MNTRIIQLLVAITVLIGGSQPLFGAHARAKPVPAASKKGVKKISCPVCTFDNPPGSQKCEMCGSPLAAKPAADSDDEKEVAGEIFEAKDFFKKVAGMNEKELRKQLDWNSKEGYLGALAHLKTSKAFNAWKQAWIKEFPQRAAIFAGVHDFKTVGQLNALIDKKGPIQPLGKAQFNILLYDPHNPELTEITRLQADPSNNGALFQLASTFFGPLEGGLEDPARSITEMLKHPVQGEWGSISAAGATIYRKYFMPTENWIKRREGLSHDPSYFYSLYHLRDKAPRTKPRGNEWPDWRVDLQALKHYKYEPQDKLNVGIFTHANIVPTSQQTGHHAPGDAYQAPLLNIPFNSDHRITQVLNSAYDLKPYYKEINAGQKPHNNVLYFAEMVLPAMYDGTLKSAYLHGNQKVYLTLLGGGAFLNDVDWIANVFEDGKTGKPKPIVDFIKQAGLNVNIIYRPDKAREIPVRTAQKDIAFLKRLYHIADLINGTNNAETIINSPKMQDYFDYIRKHYKQVALQQGGATPLPSRRQPQQDPKGSSRRNRSKSRDRQGAAARHRSKSRGAQGQGRRAAQ